MKTYNALSKSFTDEVKTIMGGGKSIDEAFKLVKLDIVGDDFDEPTITPESTPTPSPGSTPTTTPEPIDALTQGDGQQDGYYYVDLGLSVKWATCNVGADLASDDGLLFQFGRVDGYRYNDSSNQFRTPDQNTQDTGNSYIPLTTSGKVYKPNEILDLVDDAAHVNMGGKWRMPTGRNNYGQYDGELGELFNNTTHEVKTINNKPGMLFTSNKNGHQLFIPFAGEWDIWYGGFYNAGSNGRVWSSQNNAESAYRLYCDSRGASIYTNRRIYAYSVRGVFKK